VEGKKAKNGLRGVQLFAVSLYFVNICCFFCILLLLLTRIHSKQINYI